MRDFITPLKQLLPRVIVLLFVSLPSIAQQKPLIILEGRELAGTLSDLSPDSIADIQRFKGALVEHLYDGAESATVVLLKNDFPKSLGVDIPKDYLDKCS